MEFDISNEDWGTTIDNFVKKKLNKLDNITLMEILSDVVYRNIFVKFIQKIHPNQEETGAMKMLKRYILCQKILLNQENFNDKNIYIKLIKYCPSFIWELKIQNLSQNGRKDLNFMYVMEQLKWETIIDLICHDGYKAFLLAIKQKSKVLVNLLREVYELFYY